MSTIVSDQLDSVEETKAPASESEKAAKRILVVDDHPIFRHGIVQLINSEEDFNVVGEVSSAIEAMEALRRMEADAVIVDVSLQGCNGIELIKHLSAEHPKLPILVLSMHEERDFAVRALRAGADGYIMKREHSDEFVQALRRVLSGKIYVSPQLSERLIQQAIRGDQEITSPVSCLSDREVEILQLVGQGRSSRAIAEQLHLSTKTVESHRLRMKDKLGMTTSAELVRFAVGWVGDQQP